MTQIESDDITRSVLEYTLESYSRLIHKENYDKMRWAIFIHPCYKQWVAEEEAKKRAKELNSLTV
jgi:hypothetical protein